MKDTTLSRSAQALVRFHDALRALPAPGEGQGCNRALLGAANRGVWAGLSANHVFSAIRSAVPAGRGRHNVSDTAIQRAVSKAFREISPRLSCSGRSPAYADRVVPPAPSPPSFDAPLHLRPPPRGKVSCSRLEASSPVRIPRSPAEHGTLFLQTFYKTEDRLFIGDVNQAAKLGSTLRPMADWLQIAGRGLRLGPYICPNAGGRDLVSLKLFRFYVAEHDHLSRDDQLVLALRLPIKVRAVIFSGRRSVHLWVPISALTLEAWRAKVAPLHGSLLALGYCRGGSNPAQIFRMPGHFRAETRCWQRLCWLSENPDGELIQF